MGYDYQNDIFHHACNSYVSVLSVETASEGLMVDIMVACLEELKLLQRECIPVPFVANSRSEHGYFLEGFLA